MKRLLLALTFIGLLLAIPVSFAAGYIASETNKEYALKNSSPEISGISKEKLWNEVNTWRTNNDLPTYKEDPYLCEIAEKRLTTIQATGLDNHQGMKKMIDNNELKPYIFFGENLASNFFVEKDIISGWQNSPLHLKNLKEVAPYSCIATDGNYVVQLFANY